MKITRENLEDVIVYFMDDNEVDYLCIRASVSANGDDIIMNISEDLEYDDDE